MAPCEWFTAAEIAAMGLPGVPTSKVNVLALAERDDWRRPEWAGKRWRRRAERGGGFEYHWSVLPPDARLTWSAANAIVNDDAERTNAQAAGTDAALWDWFFKQTEKSRAEADRRLQVLDMVRDMVERTGRPKLNALIDVAQAFGVSKSAVYDWERKVKGRPRTEWLPLLAPSYAGRTATAECSPEAWNALYAEYARQSKPLFSDAYFAIWKVAKENGWILPSRATMWRRMQQVPVETLTLAREGRHAVKAKFPHQDRDRSVFHALQAVNADGHKWDVFVRWADGVVGRPMMVGFQDLYSDMFLSWKVDRTENLYLVQRAFGEMVETYGIPDLCYLDNGRGFTAKALTGGIKNRFRYKYREAEPEGIMKQLGVDVRFTLPYSGQSKPIERGFGDFARRIAKDIRFEGAYCGNSPGARPEDFDASKAVPIELFLQVVGEGIRDHNARAGRRTKVCAGKLSFQQAFEISYNKSQIKKASPKHKQLWLLAAQHIKPRAPDSSIYFHGNRYWAQFLQQFTGASLTVRFDPDALHEDLHVYHWDGSYLGAAPCLEAVGFNDMEAAKIHARNLATYRRNAAANDAIERGGMTTQRLIELTKRDTEAPPLPETKVVRMFNGNAAIAARPAAEQEREAETDELFVAAAQARRAQYGQLRLVEEAGDD
jgi:transposase InsO family protein